LATAFFAGGFAPFFGAALVGFFAGGFVFPAFFTGAFLRVPFTGFFGLVGFAGGVRLTGLAGGLDLTGLLGTVGLTGLVGAVGADGVAALLPIPFTVSWPVFKFTETVSLRTVALPRGAILKLAVSVLPSEVSVR